MIVGLVRDCWHRPRLAMCVVTGIARYRHRVLWLASCAVASSEFTILMCWIGEGVAARSETRPSLLGVIGCFVVLC